MQTILAIIFVTSVATLLHMTYSDLYRIAAKTFGFVISEAVSWAACYSEGATVYKRGTVFAAKLQG